LKQPTISNPAVSKEAVSELHSIVDVARWGMSRFFEAEVFFGHGTDNAWDEALSLVLHALHLPSDFSMELIDCRVTTTEKQAAIELIERRINERLPAPYITHKIFFAGLEFYVDQRVLIPRSPIAELIENDFTPWLRREPLRILEIGTGSGCIAIACAMQFPEAVVDATDISKDALAVAKKNVDRYHLKDRVHLIEADLFPHGAKLYDLIISNPPYVSSEEMAALPPEYHHEPQVALAAGPDGLDIVSRILKQAGKYIDLDGILVVEVGNSEHALINRFPELTFTWPEFKRGGGGVFVLDASQLKAR
jgi:ribosomal protein L3 glutamine methyltransferase